MSIKKDRKKKSSDKDIRAFFQDYHKAQAKLKRLLAITISRQLSEDEKKEREDMKLFIECIEGIVDNLEPLISQIIRDCYINQKSLFNISLELNYCYEHVSYLKNIGCDVLRKILRDDIGVVDSEYGKTLEKMITLKVRGIKG